MSTARYLIGDTRDVSATLPSSSIDLLFTSPPFLALRSYLPADHPDKAREIGSEPGPAEFLDTLLELTAEWSRLVTPHGTIAVELGDTYSGSGGSGGDYRDGEMREGQAKWSGSAARRSAENDRPSRTGRNGNTLGHADKDRYASMDTQPGWPLAKSLTLVPELYRIALAYGINPLTGRKSPAGCWRVRNVVRWVRPNPPVGALGDKFRPGTSEIVIACRAKDRWFDLDAVRTVNNPDRMDEQGFKRDPAAHSPNSGFDDSPGANSGEQNPAGAPPLDWWKISPGGYSGAHYAVFPPELCVKPIQAMCPREVCRECGEPRRRITQPSEEYATMTGTSIFEKKTGHDRGQVGRNRGNTTPRVTADMVTTGWSDCGHGDYRPGVVFDPFAGSGTTLAVATGHGRDAIGIDIDERNADLARDRIGMFLEVEDHRCIAAVPIPASAQHEGQEATS